MGFRFITEDSSTSVNFTDADTTLVLVNGVTLSASGNGILAVGDALDRVVVVDGKINTSASGIGSGVVFGYSGAGDLHGAVVVSETGSISAGGMGVSGVADGMDIVNRGAIVARQSGVGVTGAQATVTNEGSVTSTNGSAWTISSTQGQLVNTGTLIGQANGAVVAGDRLLMTNNGGISASTGAGIVASGTAAAITNNGKIGATGYGIIANGAAEIVTNNGTIGSGASAIIAKGSGAIVTNSGALQASVSGIIVTGADSTITNSKTIEVGGIAIAVTASGAIVNNQGTINGLTGISVVGDAARGANSGTIAAGKGTAVDYLKADHASFNNSGVLSSGSGTAFKGGDGQQSLTNSGTIKGDVQLGGGNDYFDGRGGTVMGKVAGGAGHDTYVIDNAQILLVEAKKGGNDLVISSVSYALADNFEFLTLGGSQAVNATGNGLANRIHGNSAANRIDGKDGNDLLWGHGGNDILTGGKGVDQFVFSTGDGNDVITDFAAKGKSHDILDFTNLESINSFADLKSHARQVGSDVLIDATGGDSILLKNVKIGFLDKGDFYF